MVVEAGEALAGVARFDRAPAPTGPSAELGILLADAWQARGLGREVVAWLRDEAVCRGLSEFTAVALGENRRVLRLLRRAFPAMRATLAYGQYELTMPFGAAAS
jgi:acetyltransferase